MFVLIVVKVGEMSEKQDIIIATWQDFYKKNTAKNKYGWIMMTYDY